MNQLETYVCLNVKEMGPFWASSELNKSDDFTHHGCKIFNIGEKICIIMFKNAVAGHILCEMDKPYTNKKKGAVNEKLEVLYLD